MWVALDFSKIMWFRECGLFCSLDKSEPKQKHPNSYRKKKEKKDCCLKGFLLFSPRNSVTGPWAFCLALQLSPIQVNGHIRNNSHETLKQKLHSVWLLIKLASSQKCKKYRDLHKQLVTIKKKKFVFLYPTYNATHVHGWRWVNRTRWVFL